MGWAFELIKRVHPFLGISYTDCIALYLCMRIHLLWQVGGRCTLLVDISATRPSAYHGWAALLGLPVLPVVVSGSSGALRQDGVCDQMSEGEESVEDGFGQDHLLQRRCGVAHFARHITSDAG